MVRKIVTVRFAHVVAGVSRFVGYFLWVVPVQLGTPVVPFWAFYFGIFSLGDLDNTREMHPESLLAFSTKH